MSASSLPWLALVLTTLPTPAAQVVGVDNGGLLFTDNPAGVSGTDAGYSIPLGQVSLWLFGDVFLTDPTDPLRPWVGALSNTGLLVPRGTGAAPLRHYRFFTDPATGLARPLLRLAEDEDDKTRLWPFGGRYDAASGTTWLYYGVVRVTPEGGPFGFRVLGHGLARAVGPPETLVFERLPAPVGGWLWWPSEPGPVFGAAVITPPEPDGYVYLVGDLGGHQGGLARVPTDRMAELSAYEYLAGDGPTWSTRAGDAVAVPGLADFPAELSVAWNAYLGGYLAVHSVGISERIRLSLAPRPWGPYTSIGEIGAPHQALRPAFCYAGKEHPELAEDDGRVIYVTYVDNERYWLQLLRVTLER